MDQQFFENPEFLENFSEEMLDKLLLEQEMLLKTLENAEKTSENVHKILENLKKLPQEVSDEKYEETKLKINNDLIDLKQKLEPLNCKEEKN